jgi:hypothetical protein
MGQDSLYECVITYCLLFTVLEEVFGGREIGSDTAGSAE